MDDAAQGHDQPDLGETDDMVPSRRALLRLGALGGAAIVTIRPAVAQAATSVLTCQIPVPDSRRAGQFIAADGAVVPPGTAGAFAPPGAPLRGGACEATSKPSRSSRSPTPAASPTHLRHASGSLRTTSHETTSPKACAYPEKPFPPSVRSAFCTACIDAKYDARSRTPRTRMQGSEIPPAIVLTPGKPCTPPQWRSGAQTLRQFEDSLPLSNSTACG